MSDMLGNTNRVKEAHIAALRMADEEIARRVGDLNHDLLSSAPLTDADVRGIPSKPGHVRPDMHGNGDANGTGKPSNPKDIVGSTKLSLSLVPWTLSVCGAMGFLEGALKYGRFNWRVAGVRASIYVDALLRHVAKWWNGQDCDKATMVHHLDNAIATLGILRDAMVYDMLEDDRPPAADPDRMATLIDSQGSTIAHLKELFKDHNPYQFTIKDTPRIILPSGEKIDVDAGERITLRT